MEIVLAVTSTLKNNLYSFIISQDLFFKLRDFETSRCMTHDCHANLTASMPTILLPEVNN